ncbi:MAG: hypothetical protein N3D84_02660 [Candidatus Woesearchaeota archaeon]|nr:hypothetical protein [Candidatus Woesearchaeota archaeon]
MNFITYLLIAAISYLGLLAGFALGNIAPEELKPGKKYMEAARSFSYILAIIFLLYLKEPAIGLIVIGVILMHLKYGKGTVAANIEYGALGVVFSLLSFDNKIFAIVASLVFIYGIAVGLLMLVKIKEKEKKRLSVGKQIAIILASNLLFFVTALPLYFLNLKIVP